MRVPLPVVMVLATAAMLVAAATPAQAPSEAQQEVAPSLETTVAGAPFSGLVYVKQGRVGTRSEGPDYFLQTARSDLPLRFGERYAWEPDYRLEHFGRRIVEVDGGFEGDTLVVKNIRASCATRIPEAAVTAAGAEDNLLSARAAGPRSRLLRGRYSGLVFVKHGRVGTRSEGPDYFLQTARGDLELRFRHRLPWAPDPELEMYCRRFVEVEGQLNGAVLYVSSVRELCTTLLPE